MNYEAYKRQFYVKVANKSNYANKESAEDFYNGMVKVIIDGLLEKGRVYLPGLGEFKIGTAHPAWLKNRGYGENHALPRTIKFRISNRFKAFIKSL